MRRRFRAATLGVACSVALALGAQAQAAQSHLRLDYYTATMSAETYADVLAKGYDVAAVRDVTAGKQVDLVLAAKDLNALRKQGVRPTLKKNAFGRTARQEAAQQAANGFTVWRDYDSADGIAAQLKAIAKANKHLAKLEKLGKTGQGRDILAIRLRANG